MSSVTTQDEHRQALLAEMHPALRQLYQQQCVLDGRFRITDVVGVGGFASVLQCVDLQSGPAKLQVAAKVSVDAITDDAGNLSPDQMRDYKVSMKHESAVYKALLAGCVAGSPPPGIPAVYGAVYTKRAFDAACPKKMCFLSFLVMELLGKDAWHLACEQQAYKDNQALLVAHALSMLKALQHMHSRGYVHRDVKPENFCLPTDCSLQQPGMQLRIVDMGMAMLWQHKGFNWQQRDARFYGTVDFASVRSLRSHHPTPLDDLEGLGCVLLEMAKGCSAFCLLRDDEAGQPLQPERLGQLADIKEKEWAAYLAKESTPAFVKQWLRYLRSLPPQHVPGPADYDRLEGILRGSLRAPAAATSAAWSCAVHTLQQQQQQEALSVCRKRMAPAPSGASCMSDTATVVQSKRLRAALQEPDEADECGVSCGPLLSVTPDE